MAKDMLDAICAAESEAEAREDKATQAAAEQTAKAKDDAKALIEQRKADAEKEAAEKLDKAKAEHALESENAKAQAEKQCEEISALAGKNRESVIKKAAEMLLR